MSQVLILGIFYLHILESKLDAKLGFDFFFDIFFTDCNDCTIVKHHCKPPLGSICWSLFPSIEHYANPRKP